MSRAIKTLLALILTFSITPITVTFAGYAETVIADEPFAYYRLEEVNITDTVVDEMGNHNGTFQGDLTPAIAGAAPCTGRATEFNGGYVKLDTMGNFGSSCTYQFSVEYWVKVYKTPGVVLGVNCPPEFSTQFRVGCHYDEQKNQDYWLFYFRDDNWGRYSIYYYGQEAFDQQWHHMVWTYEAELPEMTQRWHLFIDGVERVPIITAAGGRPYPSNFNIELFIGAHNHRSVVDSPLNGCLDEVALYSHSLSPEEVISHYRAATQVTIVVPIDIKPGSDTNCFNQNDHGVIPVAILGSETLDVNEINVDTLSLQGLAVKMAGKSNKYLAHIEDVNADGYADLVTQFEDTDDWVTNGNGTATLTGQLSNGTPIEGSDSICIVP
jgi:hypothetical protein